MLLEESTEHSLQLRQGGFQPGQYFLGGSGQGQAALAAVIAQQFQGRFYGNGVRFPEKKVVQGRQRKAQGCGSVQIAVQSGRRHGMDPLREQIGCDGYDPIGSQGYGRDRQGIIPGPDGEPGTAGG